MLLFPTLLEGLDIDRPALIGQNLELSQLNAVVPVDQGPIAGKADNLDVFDVHFPLQHPYPEPPGRRRNREILHAPRRARPVQEKRGQVPNFHICPSWCEAFPEIRYLSPFF
jgi:hypothetical protein